MLYDLYAGLSGTYGGAKYQGTYEYDTEKEAYKEAEAIAIEMYQNCEGRRRNGPPSWYDIREDLNNLCPDDDFDDEDYHYYYMEEMNNWLSIIVRPHAPSSKE